MLPDNQDYEQLRVLQLELEHKQERLYADIMRQQKAIESLHQRISHIDRATLSQLEMSQRRITACVNEIKKIHGALRRLSDDVVVLQQHPSNLLPIAEFQQLPKQAKRHYLGGVAGLLSGFVVMIIARGGSIEVGSTKISAPAMDVAGLALALGGGGAAAYAAKSREGSE